MEKMKHENSKRRKESRITNNEQLEETEQTQTLRNEQREKGVPTEPQYGRNKQTHKRYIKKLTEKKQNHQRTHTLDY
jgi:hypothetical protein|tara:strand:+ start:262 stop:492 length:231 start_codon:yes stop_codon:yes gene_type:complete